MLKKLIFYQFPRIYKKTSNRQATRVPINSNPTKQLVRAWLRDDQTDELCPIPTGHKNRLAVNLQPKAANPQFQVKQPCKHSNQILK